MRSIAFFSPSLYYWGSSSPLPRDSTLWHLKHLAMEELRWGSWRWLIKVWFIGRNLLEGPEGFADW